MNLIPYFEAFMQCVSALLINGWLVLMVWALNELANLHDMRAVDDDTLRRIDREWPEDDV